MAEEDAEIALLHQMQAEQENVAWGDGTNGITGEEGKPENTENSDQQAEAIKEKPFADESLGVSNFSTSPIASVPHDTASLSHPAVANNSEDANSRASTTVSVSKKKKTAGGFLLDDSGDEDDAAVPKVPSVGAQQPSRPGEDSTQSTSRSSAQVPHEENVPSLGVSNAVPLQNSSNPPAPGETSDENAQALPSNTVAAAASAPATVLEKSQKARLPHDTAGILQDRIDADPRGDIEGWLSLIREHRKRNKFDEARAVYEQFFKIFPSAVRISQSSGYITANKVNRRTSGKSTWSGSYRTITFTRLSKFLANVYCKPPMLGCGLYILTTSVDEMILQMMPLVVEELLSLKHMTLFFRMWDWTKILADSGGNMSNSSVALQVRLAVVAGRISKRWTSYEKHTIVQLECQWQASNSCGRSMTSLRCP